jgi:hypothetical protein
MSRRGDKRLSPTRTRQVAQAEPCPCRGRKQAHAQRNKFRSPESNACHGQKPHSPKMAAVGKRPVALIAAACVQPPAAFSGLSQTAAPSIAMFRPGIITSRPRASVKTSTVTKMLTSPPADSSTLPCRIRGSATFECKRHGRTALPLTTNRGRHGRFRSGRRDQVRDP